MQNLRFPEENWRNYFWIFTGAQHLTAVKCPWSVMRGRMREGANGRRGEKTREDPHEVAQAAAQLSGHHDGFDSDASQGGRPNAWL
jgi:hypothetical protein